jgi:acetylornithine deacetylase/succinyl-diaminopimelate desuccinylase-like protein
MGWDVSCDARLFAGEYPDMPVITGGPGELRFAHADNEQLYLPDLFDSICFTALFLLRETGSI